MAKGWEDQASVRLDNSIQKALDDISCSLGERTISMYAVGCQWNCLEMPEASRTRALLVPCLSSRESISPYNAPATIVEMKHEPGFPDEQTLLGVCTLLMGRV
jgi:hypothetical protein